MFVGDNDMINDTRCEEFCLATVEMSSVQIKIRSLLFFIGRQRKKVMFHIQRARSKQV